MSSILLVGMPIDPDLDEASSQIANFMARTALDFDKYGRTAWFKSCSFDVGFTDKNGLFIAEFYDMTAQHLPDCTVFTIHTQKQQAINLLQKAKHDFREATYPGAL